MRSLERPTRRLPTWVAWCAGFLIAAWALVSLHAALPHAGTQTHCAVCVALYSPPAPEEAADLHRPPPLSSALRPAPVESAHSHDALGAECGRAPPRTI